MTGNRPVTPCLFGRDTFWGSLKDEDAENTHSLETLPRPRDVASMQVYDRSTLRPSTTRRLSCGLSQRHSGRIMFHPEMINPSITYN